jgi:spermidine/putrescine-binding protein
MLRPRRRVVFAALALTTIAGCTDAPADESGEASGISGEIIWADYGGTTNEAFTKIFFEPFTDETGVEVVSTVVSGTIQNQMLDGQAGDYDAMMTEYPQVQQLLTSGGAAVAFAPNGLYAGLENGGVDATVSWDQAFIEANPFVVPAMAANPDATFALAEFMADPELQAELSRRTHYGPSNSRAFDYLAPEELAELPNAPEHTTVVWADADNRAELYDELTERYTTWLTS